MKYLTLLLTITLALFSQPSLATQCRIFPSGTPTKDVTFDISNSFNTFNNAVGKKVVLSLGSLGLRASCVNDGIDYAAYATYRSYVTSLNIISSTDDGGLKYLKLNDYLAGALETTDRYHGEIHPPIQYVRTGSYDPTDSFPIDETKIKLHLKVLRPFINNTTIPKTKIFDVYVVSNTADALQVPVYSISFSGTVKVPQTCSLNSDKVVNFDFKKVSPSLFRQAGAAVASQTRSVTVTCSNVDIYDALALRLEAHNSVGNTIISDNPDVGFILANGDNNTQQLRPNDINSVIPVIRPGLGTATISLTAGLVSVTGRAPKGGVATAQAFLRLDYP